MFLYIFYHAQGEKSIEAGRKREETSLILKSSKFIQKTFKKDLTTPQFYVILFERINNGSLVKRLRHGPLKAETGVRFSHESPNKTNPNYFVTDKWFGFVFYIEYKHKASEL